jgi:uncharacterized protein with GYD domain
MNEATQQVIGTPPTQHSVLLETERVAEMRAMFHELANVFTGILVTSGLLAQKLENSDQAGVARSLCELGERGSGLVREARAILLGAFALEVNISGEREG